MGWFGKSKPQTATHQRATKAEIDAHYGGTHEGSNWNVWMPKFPLAGERDQCFLAYLVLVDGAAHLVMDGVDYGPVSPHATEALEAIAEYGGQSCPAVLRITKPNAENYSISVRRKASA